MGRVLLGLVAVLCTAFAVPSYAQEPTQPEVRLGVLAHDVHFLGGHENGADINGELLFPSPLLGVGNDLPDWIRWAAHPQPMVGASINTSGYTSEGYAGLTWTVPLTSGLLRASDGLSFGFSVAGEVNNGHVNPSGPAHEALGSNVLFRLGAEIGYQVTPRMGLYVLFEHASNADLAHYNEGLNDLGVRVGLRF